MPKRQTRTAIPQGIQLDEDSDNKPVIPILPADPPVTETPTAETKSPEPETKPAQLETEAVKPNYGRRLIRTEHRMLPHLFTSEEQRKKVNELKATFVEITRETAEQKEKKDEMKAVMSKLLNSQAKLIAAISNGEELRDTVVEVYIAGDATVVQEVRTDTFETINVREPKPDERAPELWSEEVGPSTEAEEGDEEEGSSVEGEEEE
jgi:hypothetical protein